MFTLAKARLPNCSISSAGDAVREFLIFRLYGILASWGEIAVGERRSSWSRPSKSAVLGLVAAALGLKRQENDRHAALAEGYGFAIRVDAPGVPLRDFHTVQTAHSRDVKKLQKKDARPLTRGRELSVKVRVTILSQRDYYADALYTAALWARHNAPISLFNISNALLRPEFALYLGRKSCPLSLPLAPEVIKAGDLFEALAAYRLAEPTELIDSLSTTLNQKDVPILLAWEDGVVPTARLRPIHVECRRDVPRDRLRWHYSERNERVAILPK